MPHPQQEGRQLNGQNPPYPGTPSLGVCQPLQERTVISPLKKQAPYSQLLGASAYKHFNVKLTGTGGQVSDLGMTEVSEHCLHTCLSLKQHFSFEFCFS